MDDEKYIETLLIDTIGLERIKDPKDQRNFRKQFLEMIDVVDDKGEIIGQAPRGLCHRLGLRHKTVYILVIRSDGKILLQQRGGGIDAILGRLDIAVGGHLKAGENDPKLTAYREMQEELGFSPQKDRMMLIAEYNRDAPTTISKPFERNRERRYLFKYTFTDDETDELDDFFRMRESKGEVVSISWHTIEEICSAIDKGKIADGLLTSFMHYLGELSVCQ